MNVLVTGSNGLLGSELHKYGKKHDLDISSLSRSDICLELGLSNAINVITKTQCQVLIHCAANTDVDGCENDQIKCYKDNVLLTELITNACSQLNVKLVFISSTGIYGDHQDTPYTEYDEVRPTTTHHRSKFIAEESIRNILSDALIIRTGWLFGGGLNIKKNFVVNRINEARYSKGEIQSDSKQYGNPTYAADVANRVFMLIKSGWKGVFNCVNDGVATRYEYVNTIIKLSGLQIKVSPSEKQFKRSAKVSSNESALNFKMNSFGFLPMPTWQSSLERYISNIKEELTL